MHAAPEDPDVAWDGAGGVLVTAEDVGDDFAGVGGACDAGVDVGAVGIDLAWAGEVGLSKLVVDIGVGDGLLVAVGFGCRVIHRCWYGQSCFRSVMAFPAM